MQSADKSSYRGSVELEPGGWVVPPPPSEARPVVPPSLSCVPVFIIT